MLLAAYRADASSNADHHIPSLSSSLNWEGGVLKANRRLLMSISSTRHLSEQQQQQAAAKRIQEAWAGFWASDAPRGT